MPRMRPPSVHGPSDSGHHTAIGTRGTSLNHRSSSGCGATLATLERRRTCSCSWTRTRLSTYCTGSTCIPLAARVSTAMAIHGGPSPPSRPCRMDRRRQAGHAPLRLQLYGELVMSSYGADEPAPWPLAPGPALSQDGAGRARLGNLERILRRWRAKGDPVELPACRARAEDDAARHRVPPLRMHRLHMTG